MLSTAPWSAPTSDHGSATQRLVAVAELRDMIREALLGALDSRISAIRDRRGAKICGLELIIPGYSNDPGAISQYMSTFNQLFGLLKDVSTVRVLLRVHKDQKLSRDGTISHEKYLYTFFNFLGRYMPSIRQLTVIIILERNAEHRKIQIECFRSLLTGLFVF
ncbi:hypothetical protein NpPPO83_00006812, partial [Neofusicoccum parvum]